MEREIAYRCLTLELSGVKLKNKSKVSETGEKKIATIYVIS